MIEFDPNKNAKNIAKHGISLDEAQNFDWTTMLVWQDTRYDYGENRYCGLGLLNGRLYAVVFTPRVPKLRIISLRKAGKKEVKHYETHKPT